MELNFRKAFFKEKEQIYYLYKSVVGTENCVWSFDYPSMLEIDEDLNSNNLYVLIKNKQIIGAISIVPKNELANFQCWKCDSGREIARVVIHKEYQGLGLSYYMVEKINYILFENGYKSVHLAVYKNNIAAYKTYLKAGFNVVSEEFMYGNNYYLMEKIFCH